MFELNIVSLEQNARLSAHEIEPVGHKPDYYFPLEAAPVKRDNWPGQAGAMRADAAKMQRSKGKKQPVRHILLAFRWQIRIFTARFGRYGIYQGFSFLAELLSWWQ